MTAYLVFAALKQELLFSSQVLPVSRKGHEDARLAHVHRDGQSR